MQTTHERLTEAREVELAAWRAIDAAYEVQRKATARVNVLEDILRIKSMVAKPATQTCRICGAVEANDGRGFTVVTCEGCKAESHRQARMGR